MLRVTLLYVIMATKYSTALAGSKAKWNYKDTESWKDHFKQCSGNLQSPIDIEPNKAKSARHETLFFGNYAKPLYMNVTNTGHTVLVSADQKHSTSREPFVQGGGLGSRYTFIQFHYHWGNDSKHGSEHTIQKKRYAAELHLVHFNAKYKSFREAMKHKDGLAVLAILMERSRVDNKALTPVISQLGKVKRSGQVAKIPEAIRLRDLLPADVERFFRYSGSLTTPECHEIVAWTVFESAISISESQLNKFRKLLDGDGSLLVNNYRPVRKKGKRIVVYRNRKTRNE